LKAVRFLFVIAAIGCATAPAPPPAAPISPQAKYLPDPRLGWTGTSSDAIEKRFDAAWRAIFAGDFDDARKRLADIESRDASYAPAKLAEAAIDLMQGHADVARPAIESIAAKYPQYSAAQVFLAEVDIAQDRIRSAYDRYRQIVSQPNPPPGATARLAEMQTRVFDQLYGAALNAAPVDAIPFLRDALQVMPDATAARLLLAEKLLAMRQFDEARTTLDPIANTSAAAQPEFQETIAEIDVGKGQYEDAIARYERLARNDPGGGKYAKRLDQVKQLFAAANLPPQVMQAMQAPALTRADLAVLMYWTISSIRFAPNVPTPPIAIDIGDIPGRDEVIRAMALGIYPVDPVTRRVNPDAEVTGAMLAKVAARVLSIRGATCARVPNDQILSACGVTVTADDLPVSGETATSVLQQVDRAVSR